MAADPAAFRLDNKNVPQCSMYNRCEVSKLHLDVTRKVARDIVGTIYLCRVSAPVYLMQNRSYYIDCLDAVPDERKTWRFDHKKAIDGIDEILSRTYEAA